MFGQSTITQLPPEYLTDYAAWDDYMAHVWLSLFQEIASIPRRYVVEIACGTSRKIGKALHLLGFAGDFYVVDPCLPALQATCDFYTRLMPDATIHAVPLRIEEAIPTLPLRPEWIAANHPLDDMLLAQMASAEEMGAMFDWGEKPNALIRESVMRRWKTMQAEAQIAPAQQEIIHTFGRIMTQLQPDAIAISQYASASLSAVTELHALSAIAGEMLHQLRTQLNASRIVDIQPMLNQHPHYQMPYIGNQVLNADNWLVGIVG